MVEFMWTAMQAVTAVLAKPTSLLWLAAGAVVIAGAIRSVHTVWTCPAAREAAGACVLAAVLFVTAAGVADYLLYHPHFVCTGMVRASAVDRCGVVPPVLHR